ncbi:hypothetical protein NQ315_012364 [Exocentrus adspersus]|uniref:Uncharacterized protein n=1 Tax=Exocentrus adspersus TaxID=1586481 RepID=A0AAV8VCS2_9CUCU|nr:hypothetical protein NQ315_012364 [Exocentrus adspersus]
MIDGYNLVRNDHNSRGGGVAFYVKNIIKYKHAGVKKHAEVRSATAANKTAKKETLEIAKDFVKTVRRFNLVGRTLEFKIKSILEGQEPVSWVREAINQVIAKGTEGLNPEDQVMTFSFCSKDGKKGDGCVPCRPVSDVTYDDIWKVISSIYQSNSTGLNTETFCLGVTSVKMPGGRGRAPLSYFHK